MAAEDDKPDCLGCKGSGKITVSIIVDGKKTGSEDKDCPSCQGSGKR